MRSGTAPLARCGSAGFTRPWAHASAPKRTLPSWPNVAPSGFPQALPEGEVLPQLRCSIQEACWKGFVGGTRPTAASPLSPKLQHCGGIGFLETIFPGCQPGGSKKPRMRRPHLAVGISPWNTPAPTTRGAKMLLQFGAHGVTMSWDDGFLGARASRPHQAWHSLGHLSHLDQPGTAPWVSFDLADAVPADRVVACSIARKLSGGQRDRMRAGRPRSQAMPSRLCGGGCLAGDFSESRPAPCGKLPYARQPCPALPCGSFQGETTGPYAYQEQGPCPVNAVCCIIEHRYTG